LDRAAIAKAQLNLERTVIRSPVNGYVTNLLARLGHYATVGTKLITVVDADSFWVDGYFEETSLAKIHEATRQPSAHGPQGHRRVIMGENDGKLEQFVRVSSWGNASKLSIRVRTNPADRPSIFLPCFSRMSPSRKTGRS